jgi:hypothetical protein
MPNDYPAWERPPFVGDVPIEDLPADLAKQYCEWFVAQVPDRVTGLLSRLGVVDDGGDDLLERAEKPLQAYARSPQFWRPSVGPQPVQLRVAVVMVDLGEELTDAGEALGLDVGVLLARDLERTVPNLRWGIERPRRDYVSYNRPLLIGPSPPPYDPQLVGPNVVRSAIQGDDRPRPLPQLLAKWQELLSGDRATTRG